MQKIVLTIVAFLTALQTSPVVANSNQNKKVSAVCIFDIDNTLTHGATAGDNCPNTQFFNEPAPGWPVNGGTTNWVKSAIKKCESQGYHIAIATAESGKQSGTGGTPNDKQHQFLSSLSDRFDDNFFLSAAFQTSCKVVTAKNQQDQWCADNEFPRKEMMIISIMNHFNIAPPDWSHSIMFDDDQNNLATARNLNLKTAQSSPGCRGTYCTSGCGITEPLLNEITELPKRES